MYLKQFKPSLNSKRIAIYSGSIPTTEFIERLICGLATKGYEILLFGPINGEIPKYPVNIKVVGNKRKVIGKIQTCYRLLGLLFRNVKSFKILRFELNCLPWQNFSSFALWQRHVPILLNMPDIFHIQWAKNCEQFLYLKKRFGVKLILSLRGAHINYSPLANPDLELSYKRTFPEIDSFHAVSNAISKEAQKYGANPKKINVIYSGLPLLNFEILSQNTLIEIEDISIKLLTVGRFHWKKGYIYLLEALYHLKCRGISIQLTIIAAGSMPEEELYFINEKNLIDNIIHIRGLPFRGVQQAMCDHDVLILPSLEEGIANVVLEAMQIGLPVISTDCGGMREVIINKENGLLIPIRNSIAIVDAINYLMNLTINEKNKMIDNAKETVKFKFNMLEMASEFANLYNTTLEI